MNYTAKMKHSGETITRLVVMQYDTFQFGKKFVRILFSLVLIAYGALFLQEKMVTPILALFLGCMMIAGLNTRPKHNANLLIKQMNGKFPSSDYYFSETGFKDSVKSEEIPYSRLVRLVDDRKYMYFYVTKESAYMVDNASVKGEGGLEGLKDFVAAKSGLKWTRPVTLLNFGLNTFRQNRGREDNYSGPRLTDRNFRRY